MVLLVQVQVQPDAAQKEGMAHGDQVRCPLGAHDAGNLGCRQHIAFFHPAAFDQFKCMGIEQHTTFCHGSSFCNLLVAHIDHPGPAALVKMGEILFCHFLFVSCAFFIAVFITVYSCFINARGNSRQGSKYPAFNTSLSFSGAVNRFAGICIS